MGINDVLSNINTSDHNDILKAYNFANKKLDGIKRQNGDTMLSHCLNVAYTLSKLNVDNITIISSLLHEVLHHKVCTYDELVIEFGEEVATVVKSVTQINELKTLTSDSEQEATYLRKVMVGLCEDVRVLFIKLADRLHNMQTMDVFDKSHQMAVCNETISVLVPIAHRLGINSIKSELENLWLYYTKPDVYNDILTKLNEKKMVLEDELNNMKNSISKLLKDNDIEFKIKSRVKSVYSIYNKLSNGKKWNDIYDILALRVFVEKTSECYAVMGLIHSKYRPVPNRFKDYIAVPKENMYQSLHTTIFGDDGLFYEVQIRTYEMDEIAEKGIASHWSYKEHGVKKVQSMMEQKLELYRNIIESSNEDDLESNINDDILSESIYVYTPKGDVMELPKGSTPIDFAYRVHSKVGDTMVGAIVNDLMVPIDTPLNDNDIIKILTNPNSKPKKDWINMVKTASAKSKIKSYFSKIDHDEYILKGKNIIEKEVRKRKLGFNEVFNDENVTRICNVLNLKDLEDIYLSVGSLRYTANYIINLVVAPDISEDALIIKKKENKTSHKADILVDGKTSILTHLAKCCNPVKGDDIVGIITRTEGIAIHRKGCSNISCDENKLIDVKWNDTSSNTYKSTFMVEVATDKDMVSDILAILTGADIDSDNIYLVRDGIYNVTVRVSSSDDITKAYNALNKLRYIKDVKRI